MRRSLILVIMVAAAAVAATLALGAAPQGGGAQTAKVKASSSPLAALDRTFRGLIPSARCPEGAPTATLAKRRRAAALSGAATAPPKALKRKRASMRSAIARMRDAVALCTAAAAPPGTSTNPGGVTPPGGTTTTPTTPPPPTPAPVQTIALHVASGVTFHFTETSATATAGTIRVQMDNASSLQHFVAARTGPGQPAIAESPSSTGGTTVSVDLTLPAGSYQLYCHIHVGSGMVIPLTVTP